MRSMKKTTSMIALASALTLGLAACGSDEDTSTDPGTSTESSAPEAQAEPSPVAVLENLTGESTQVTLDPMFVQGITDLGLTPGVTGGAEFDGEAGTVTFPISGGNATYFTPDSGVDPYVQGMIEHNQAGLTLTAGDTEVELSNFLVDPGTSMLMGKVLVNGEPFPEGGGDVPLFILDGSTLKPLEVMGDKGILEGTQVKLTKTAADALNMVFKVDALAEGFPVGIAKITLNLK